MPDYVLILPWNFRDEIVAQLSTIKEWGGTFVVLIRILSADENQTWAPVHQSRE